MRSLQLHGAVAVVVVVVVVVVLFRCCCFAFTPFIPLLK